MDRITTKNIFSFCAIAIIISSCNFFRPLPHKLFKRAVKNEPYDVIIVPGYPYDGKDWATVMKGRVIWANFLIKNGVAKNVIFSGAAVYTPFIEGEVMALYGEAIGIPKEKIFVESKAEHGTENIYYSYQMAKKMGFTKIAFASDPIQSNYLMGFSKRRFKLPIAHIPFVIDTLEGIDDILPVIDPSPAKVENFKSIIETQTKRHRRRGSMGKNIEFEKE